MHMTRLYTRHLLWRLGGALGLTGGLLLALWLGLGILAPRTPVSAANFDLTGACPGGVGDVPALIAAINTANGNGEADTITLANGCVYTLTASSDSIDGANGLPSITAPLTIIGNGVTLLRDLSAPGFRIMHVGATGALTLTQITLQQGLADAADGDWTGQCGGGLLTRGQLHLNNTTISDSTALAEGGGIYAIAPTVPVTITLNQSAIVSNVSNYDGGGIYAESDYPITFNITQSSLSYNQTVLNGFGGGLSLRGSGGSGITVHIADSQLNGNQTSRGGGGIYYTNYSQAAVIIHVERSIISGNQTDDSGGGIGSFSDGQAQVQLHLSDSTVSDNTAWGDGGGILVAGAVTISNSAIVRNTAQDGGEWFGYGNGGGLITDWGAGSLMITNTTISGNRADGDGGGIAHFGGELHLLHVTVANNTADSDQEDPYQWGGGNGGGLLQGATSYITATIIASNTDNSVEEVYADCYQVESLPFSGGYNLIGDDTGCAGVFVATGDIVNTPPNLAPLALNLPGSTETHELLPGSPALDHIPAAQCQVTADQRGVLRPQPTDGQCDIGALEQYVVVCEPITGVSFVSDSPVTLGQMMHFTATATPGNATLPLTYTWDFGSGPVVGGATASHTFAVAGSHSVTLTIANPCGAATLVDSITVLPPVVQSHFLYLPLVLRSGVPDLVVTSIILSNDQLTVTIQNIGTGPVVNTFWVDFYVDPQPAPTAVNQVWYDGRSRQGVVWGIAQALAPGEVLTLTLHDSYWSDYYSDPLTVIAAGTPLYAQVDSVNLLSSYGGVLESHEMVNGPYNNILQITAPETVTFNPPPTNVSRHTLASSLPVRSMRLNSR